MRHLDSHQYFVHKLKKTKETRKLMIMIFKILIPVISEEIEAGLCTNCQSRLCVIQIFRKVTYLPLLHFKADVKFRRLFSAPNSCFHCVWVSLFRPENYLFVGPKGSLFSTTLHYDIRARCVFCIQVGRGEQASI